MIPGNLTDEQPTEPQGEPAGQSFAAATPKRGVSPQSLVLALVVVGSAGVLFGMRHFGLGPGSAIAADVEIDYKIDGAAAAAVPDGYAHVMDALDRSSRPMQVAAAKLTQDPFVLLDLLPDPEGLDGEFTRDSGENAARLVREREAKRRREVQADFNTLQLQSVLGGRVPVARIGSSIVRAGDPVGESFMVKAISGRSVLLVTEEGWEFTLSMEETGLGGGGMSVTRQGEDD